ncbi:NUDIX domain-containing protein [Myriangium duriaei CBS 260.36]|uniref:NUDIX domain-containing protein n=1 Tax=Myriangium duriaei CBS 260.36 TaxID=1168546 RepID=A0A9P4MG26_9PEZI|nr:NUDIX domain-containing protein [Myriangium duriaei CBS 260.36]
MAALSPTSAAAIARLRAFRPPPSTYHSLPLTRRAAVLILLFADRRGELRVVLTIRSAKLKSYAGHAALPGGKADALSETAWVTARREAEEEIGLPRDDTGEEGGLGGWEVEQLAELPANLAVTELGVRPCVGWLKARKGWEGEGLDPARDLLPKLDAREVEAVFTAPFEGFLRKEGVQREERGTPGRWYHGTWVDWHEEKWRMHQFFVPKGVVYRSEAGKEEGERAVREEQVDEERGKDGAVNYLEEPRFKVHGMTARILVDAARVAYGVEPEFEHNSHFGDEDMIRRLMKMGRLSPVKKEGDGLTRDVMRKARATKL